MTLLGARRKIDRRRLGLSRTEVPAVFKTGVAGPAEPMHKERLAVILMVPFGLSDFTAALAPHRASDFAEQDGVLEHLSALLTRRMGLPVTCLACFPMPPLRASRTER